LVSINVFNPLEGGVGSVCGEVLQGVEGKRVEEGFRLEPVEVAGLNMSARGKEGSLEGRAVISTLSDSSRTALSTQPPFTPFHSFF
jgi:hypothetical protein